MYRAYRVTRRRRGITPARRRWVHAQYDWGWTAGRLDRPWGTWAALRHPHTAWWWRGYADAGQGRYAPPLAGASGEPPGLDRGT
jgi:hypothetical protein